MSRWEFMRRLEELLSDISPNEREEALQYYNDYFNDAGKENEKEVIDALGSPQQVAQIVKEGLAENENQGEFTENGFTSKAAEETKNEVMKRTADKDGSERDISGFGAGCSENGNDSTGTGKFQEKTPYEGSTAEKDTQKKKDLPTWAIVLIIIACIVFSPAIIGAAGALVGILAGIIVAVLAVVLGFGLAAIICFVVAVSLVIGGFGCIIVKPFVGIGLIGGGCICAAVGILCMLVTILIAGKCIPGIIQGIAYIFSSIFGKKKGAEG